MKISFTIPGLPRPKERPRKGKHGNMYTPGKTRKYEEEVWWMAHAAGIRQDCFKGMFLKVELLFATGSSLEELLHADGDNIEKAILDGLKPAFNDAYVVDMHWRKLAWIPQLVEVALEVL